MKNLLKIKGALQLSKSKKQSINGGYSYQACLVDSNCKINWWCNGEHCVPCRYATEPHDNCL